PSARCGEIRDAARLGKKDYGLPHASHAAGRILRGHPRERGMAARELAKAAASVAVDVGRVLVSRDDAATSAWIRTMPSFACPSGQPQPSRGPGTAFGSRSRD